MITDNIQKGGGSGGGSIEVPVTIANGGTGATTAAGARANLGLGDAAVKNVTTSVSSGDTNLITSGGVYSALSNKMDKPSGSVGSANQVMYLNNGVFTAGNTLPSSVSVTTSMTSSSSSYAAAASLVYNRFVRSIAPIETSSYASTTRSTGDKFIDSSGYLRSVTSDISSGSSYSSKSTTMTLADMLSWSKILHKSIGKVGWTSYSTTSFAKHRGILIWLTVTDSRGTYCEKPLFIPTSVFVNISAAAPVRIVGTSDNNSIYLCNIYSESTGSYSRIYIYNQLSNTLVIDVWGIL